MEAKIFFCTHQLKSPLIRAPSSLRLDGKTVQFRCPEPLREAGFPVAESSFNVDVAFEDPQSSTFSSKVFGNAASNFIRNRQNQVVFSYGVRSTPKRQLMYGSGSNDGYAAKMITEAVQSGAGKGIFVISCYAIGATEHLVDLLNLSNELGVVVDSVKEGPRVRMVERLRVSSGSDVRSAMNTIVKNYQQYFASVLCERQPSAELEALPPYLPDSVVLQLYRYDDENAFTDYMDANSMTFVALGDSERPVLCGIDVNKQQLYEKAQKTLLSAAGILSSIRCNRLRIPFGRSKLSQLLRRAYNAEKGNPNNNINGDTETYFIIHAFTDAEWAEETFHCLAMTKRTTNILSSTGIGSAIKDLSVDKWRLDQDVMELRDELLIARTVYDYKPCIYEQTKAIPNIKEEEMKRINAIQSKREEAREKELNQVRERAKQDADKVIKELEAKTGTTLAELEKTLEKKKRENAVLQADREKRIKDYEQTLEKIRKKKQDEESASERLKEEMQKLEQELNVRQATIDAKQKQLEMIQLDKAKARDVIVKERKSIQAMRKTVLEERRRQRKQWINQIKEINAKVLEQVQMLSEERKKNGEQATSKEEAAEKAVMDDIKTIEEYLPKLISLEDIPVNPEETETIRRQFDEVFSQEKQSYLSKIEEEKGRKEKLERGLEVYRQRLLEAYQSKKQEKLNDAVTKEQQLNSLVDQVLIYLRNGIRMTKISSKGNVRKRFYFISEDCKRIHSCELDHQGAPISRKKPPVTIWIKDIKKVVIGLYTTSFVNYSSEAQLVKTRQEAVTDTGTYRHDPTQNLSPFNLGLNNYRSFALLLRGGKSLEVVCDTDSDCEAWLVALKRLLNYKTPVEKILEERMVASKESHVHPVDGTVDIKWGGSLDIRNMRGFVSLAPEEAALCSENHIPPALFLRVKQEMSEKSQSNTITVYDVRVSSGLDLFRSAHLYDYMCEKRIIPLPY
ncbi:putative kinesin [Trypanosoma theileri]|uniref:Putative kinesin n=1 Tax=Trypanosoma theileri TaxID=67003 RepID=A0A1X0NYF6_9TRYP|nr:putative kinesin [Trypanosoma theileri]ORC89568.1 putative kinesin [Trypanosoma theileri]